jgi:tetratricopeptide (TPR) repeat protein
LQKSEQMAFEAGKLQGISQKYPDWLEKTVERLIYVTDIRKDALEFLEQGIADVIAHITEETRLRELDAGNLETFENLITLYIDSRDYALARPLAEKYHELKPDSAQANFFLGVLAAHQRLLGQMDDCFIAAERIDSTYGTKINECRSTFGDYYFDQAFLKKNNSNVCKKFLLVGLGFCPFHEKLQNLLLEIAEQDVQKLHQADAGDKLQEHAETIEAWIQIMDTYSIVHSCLSNEVMGIIYYFGGKMRFREGEKENATALFKKSIIYLPQDAGLYLKIADLYLCTFDYDQGILYLNQAIALDKGCAGYWEGFGDFLFQKKKFEEAVSAFEQALQYFPQNTGIQEKMVQCLLQKGNMLHRDKKYIEAEKIYNQGIQLCPDESLSLVHLYNNLGSALQNTERFDLALAAYDRALEVDSNYAEALYNKGLLLQSMGETEAAARFLRKAEDIISQR